MAKIQVKTDQVGYRTTRMLPYGASIMPIANSP